jgi:hypothetical protein
MMQTAVLLIPFDITVVTTVRDQGYLFVLIKHLIGYIKIYLVYMNWDVLEIYKSKSPLNSICDDGFFLGIKVISSVNIIALLLSHNRFKIIQ